MQDFSGKTAVITGGASGIGLGLAEHCAGLGMNVVLGDIQQDALDQAVEKVAQRQANVIGVITDTMVKTSVNNLLEEATNTYGNVHLVFNNAGVAAGNSAGKAVWEAPDEDWHWVMGVNFYGVLYGVQTFIPHMLEHGEESYIVNTASLAAVMPMGGSYGVSKHGVLALTEGVQSDLEQRGANIHAGVLCPGFVDTQIFNAERNRPGVEQTQRIQKILSTRPPKRCWRTVKVLQKSPITFLPPWPTNSFICCRTPRGTSSSVLEPHRFWRARAWPQWISWPCLSDQHRASNFNLEVRFAV